MDFDENLRVVGEIGLYQVLVFSGLWFYPGFYGIHTALVNYIGPHQTHWCTVQELQNFSEEQQKYIAIPFDTNDDVYDNCKVYDIPWHNYTQQDFQTWNRTHETAGVEQIECDDWQFSDDVFISTISSEVM